MNLWHLLRLYRDGRALARGTIVRRLRNRFVFRRVRRWLR